MLLYRAPLGDIARERLNVMRDTEDGFAIAEEDLRLRGGGEVLGTRQSGLPSSNDVPAGTVQMDPIAKRRRLLNPVRIVDHVRKTAHRFTAADHPVVAADGNFLTNEIELSG